MGAEVTPHEWKPVDGDLSLFGIELVKSEPGGIVTVEPEEERRGWHCHRCGRSMTTAAFGRVPGRKDIMIRSRVEDTLMGSSVGSSFTREITGWETLEQGMKRQKMDPDCDAAVVEDVTVS